MFHRYEEDNLTETAKCVIAVNPYAVGYSLDSMKARILDVVRGYPGDKTGYVRTYGFVISFYKFEGKPSVKFSIDSSTLIDYLTKKQEG